MMTLKLTIIYKSKINALNIRFPKFLNKISKQKIGYGLLK